jgi:hypothetical protein
VRAQSQERRQRVPAYGEKELTSRGFGRGVDEGCFGGWEVVYWREVSLVWIEFTISTWWDDDGEFGGIGGVKRGLYDEILEFIEDLQWAEN